MSYYKILNKDMKHHNFQYKEGLNIDTVQFNPTGSCQSGGLYYTDEKNIIEFIDHGELIAEVTIPEDAKIYKDPDGNKWKADRIILSNIIPLKEWKLFSDPDFCLEAVKKNGCALQYVQNQTTEICLAAVQQTGYALKYVRDRDFDICFATIYQDELSNHQIYIRSLALSRRAIRRNLMEHHPRYLQNRFANCFSV